MGEPRAVQNMNLQALLIAQALLLSASPTLTGTGGASDHVFFVSPLGNDAWSGTAPSQSTNGSDGPFASLERARQAVRDLRRGVRIEGPVRIRLRGGRYELRTPLELTPEDSGTATSPTIIEAYEQEAPVLSGGLRIRKWRRVAGAHYVADVPEALPEDAAPHHLTVDGGWRSRIRLPRVGFFKVRSVPGAVADSDYDKRIDAITVDPANVPAGWTDPGSLEVVVLHFWMDAHFPVKNLGAGVIAFSKQSRVRFLRAMPRTGARYYVENVREALGEPGDWFLDPASRQLHYVAQSGESPETWSVVLPRLRHLVSLNGDPRNGRFVQWVVFRGLTFSDTAFSLPAGDAGDSQASTMVPAAVSARGLRNAGFERCVFRNLDTYGLEILDGSRDVRVVASRFAQVGAGGVKVNGGTLSDPEPLQTGRVSVTDSIMEHLGRVYHGGVGILSIHAYDGVYSHNDISDLFYTGISVGWSWGYGPSISRGNRIEFNRIQRIGQGVLSDLGGIYLLGVSPGTVVRNNFISDVDAGEAGAVGIYTDEGASGILIESNVVVRTRDGGFHQNYGRDNEVRNNVFAFSRNAQISRIRPEPFTAFRFTRNIVYFEEGELLGGNWRDRRVETDSNLYFRVGGGPVRFDGAELADWRKTGRDQTSMVADPLFVNARGMDFRLRPESPAGALGIREIDTTSIGPRVPVP